MARSYPHALQKSHKSYYGQVAASDIVQWDFHHPRLFAPNIRMFLGSTEVNQSLMDTLRNNPENFWYFNNGITALCSTIKKKRLGGEQRDAGVFECSDVTIVNGAQTVGAIATVGVNNPSILSRIMVQVRFISLENCPDHFSYDVTRATNTQNRIERRDFVALDEEQERIRTELQLDSITYIYKSGEKSPPQESGFDVNESTVALACSNQDISLAVQAKREIGKLWEDITRDPYKKLFNASLTGTYVWRMVQIQRRVDVALRKEHGGAENRDALFAVHGNRFIAHLIFRILASEGFYNPESDLKPGLERAETLTAEVLPRVIKATNRLYPDSYLASLFKNLNKCREVALIVKKSLSATHRFSGATPKTKSKRGTRSK